MDEFVLVRLSNGASRVVKVDGTATSVTGHLFIVQSGTHRFSLGGAADYTPPEIEAVVTGTTIPAPFVVEFTALEMSDALAELHLEMNHTDAAAEEHAAANEDPAKTVIG